MTALALKVARPAGRARPTRRLPARADLLWFEAVRLLATLVLVVLALAGLFGLAFAVGPVGIPPEGPGP